MKRRRNKRMKRRRRKKKRRRRSKREEEEEDYESILKSPTNRNVRTFLRTIYTAYYYCCPFRVFSSVCSLL